MVRAGAAHRAKKKRQAVVSLGPTPERLAKGDIAVPHTPGAAHRAVSAVEQLRNAGQLRAPRQRRSAGTVARLHAGGKLDHDARTSSGMLQAAERLQRHHEGLGLSIRAQDLNRVVGGIDGGDAAREEAWVVHRRHFGEACRIMGWPSGAGPLVVRVVCESATITEAAATFFPGRRAALAKAAALETLRIGLWTLACHWRMTV